MTTRKRNALILVAVLALSAALFFAFGRAPSSDKNTTASAIPSDAFLVATVDVAALNDSPLAAPLAPFVASLGADEVEKQCGFQPIARVRELSIAIPEGQDGEFGILARGALTKDEMSRCASAMISSRGGSASQTESSGFSIMSDESSALPSPSKVAWNDDGLVLVGRGGWLTQMMEAANGKRPRLDANEEHAELRTALGKGRLLVATATLPEPLRKKIEREFQGDSEGENDLMRGVLGVGAAGIALGTTGPTSEIAIELRCDDDDACVQVEKLFAKKKSEWSANIGYRLVGIGALMDDLVVNVDGKKLHAKAHLPTDDARRLIERLLELRSGGARRSDIDAGPPPLPPPNLADEVITSKPAADAGSPKAGRPDPRPEAGRPDPRPEADVKIAGDASSP